MPVEARERPRAGLFAELGLRLIGDERLLLLRPGLEIEAGLLEVALAPPLHLDLARDGALRAADWDEVSDLGRVLASLAAEEPQGRWGVRAGALAYERLGHGTLVSDYVSTLDPDHWHTGARAYVRGEAFELDALVGEILAPQVMALRGALRPLVWVGGGTAWTVGTSVAADFAAPGGTAAFVGVDSDAVLLREPAFGLAPYLDLNLRVGGASAGAAGLHGGVLVDLAIARRVDVALKLEGRWMAAGYLPEYFDTYYVLERSGYPLGGTRPKALVQLPAGWGLRGEISIEGEGAWLAALSADGRPVGPAHLGLYLAVPLPAGLVLRAALAHRGFAGARAFFENRGWIGSAELRFDGGGPLYATGRVARIWTDGAAGRRTLWDVGLSVGLRTG